MVVIVILSMVVAIVLPRLPSSDAADLVNSGKNLAATIRYLGDKAITTKSSYRFRINLKDNSIMIRKIVEGEETIDTDPFFSRPVLADGISIEDISVSGLGKTNEGEVTVGFGPGGLEDFMTIHLKGSRDKHFTVIAHPQNKRVKAVDGYQEVSP